MYKILIAEDDTVIARAVTVHLSAWGYDAHSISDLSNVAGEVRRENPALVLLDILLPHFNGYHWCGEIRKFSRVPILFLSSASDNMNIVMAMNMGGDDFVAKPFDLNVLTAKIGALLRRTYESGAPAELLERGGVILNLSDATVSFRDARETLTRNELRILSLLMRGAGHAQTRGDLITALWETDSFIDDNTLAVNIARLRRKLDGIGARDFILTRKGVGYIVE
ncbi:MAG: response regulator transcription factor [Clostridiaceae bacterium]|nr:response regulator transcription factor [Clostridiaceae bacterium]